MGNRRRLCYGLGMADPHSISILRTKRNKIMDTIAMYEAKLLSAQHDLAHVNAAMRLFLMNGEYGEITPYVDMKRVFKRGETTAFCFDALRKEGPLDTRELTERLMKHKGFDVSDRVLWRAVALRVIHTLRVHAKRKRVDNTLRRKNVTLWRISD
jgi:hypothetical protein